MTEYLYILLPLGTGALFYMTGYQIEKNPSKDRNGMSGYNTPGSRKSQKRWDFAQKYSAGKIKTAAIMMMFAAFPLYFFDQGTTTNVLVSAGIILIFTFIPIFQTEAALNEKFGDN